MRRVAVIWIGCVAACGRINFAELGPDADSDAGIARCGGSFSYADDFADGVASPIWGVRADNNASVTETGGTLTIVMPTPTPASTYAYYILNRSVDLRESRTYVEVPQVLSGAGAGNAFTIIRVDGNEFIVLSIGNGLINADYATPPENVVLGGVSDPYDPVAHRWLQYRESAGTLYLETSADGITFQPFRSMPTPAFAAYAQIMLEAIANNAVPDAGTAQYAQFNGGVSFEQLCAASTLSDDFESAVAKPGPWWEPLEGNCTIAIANGAATMSLSPTTQSTCDLVSAAGYRLAESAIVVEIESTPDRSMMTGMSMAAATLTDDRVGIGQSGTSLTCVVRIGGTDATVCDVPFDAVMHRFWRLRELGGRLFWETSRDGLPPWTEQHSQATPIALDDVKIRLGTSAEGTVANPGVARFASFNAP